MNAINTTTSTAPIFKGLPWLTPRIATDLAGPLLVVLILAMLILPLPPLLLDLFFTFNIAIAMLVLLASMHIEKPLEFSVFPTALLLTTLLRLSLNVASTRVVLMQGHNGPDAAGKVIEAFGHFLVGGNFAVGIVVFAILVVINFVVITKGAGRIAEVSARFALDAMPGKQMAIDADLNAGLINEEVARKRRTEIADEADFYGSMDGASKYVRGDAIAGILILFINMIGGIVVGVMQHDLSFADAGKTYTLLAIGDGLVAQIPSLIISMAAGMIVSRVGRGENVGHQVLGQMFRNDNALFVTGAVLALIGIIPGHAALLVPVSCRRCSRSRVCTPQRGRQEAGDLGHRRAGRAAAVARRVVGRRVERRRARPRSRLPARAAGRRVAGRRTAQAH